MHPDAHRAIGVRLSRAARESYRLAKAHGPRSTVGFGGKPRLDCPDTQAVAAEGAAGTCVMESPKSNTRGQSRALPLAARSHSDMAVSPKPADLRRMWRSLAPWAELTVGGASRGRVEPGTRPLCTQVSCSESVLAR